MRHVSAHFDLQPGEVGVSQIPPRRVRMRLGTAVGTWVGRIFILPHTLVGLGMIVLWLRALLWLVAGHNVQGAVSHAWEETHKVKGGNSTTWYITYTYDDGQGICTEKTDVSSDYAHRLPGSLVGQPGKTMIERSESYPLTVRILPLWRFTMVAPILSVGSYLGQPGVLLLFAAFWNGIVSVFLYHLWVYPYRQRRLAVWGQANGQHAELPDRRYGR